MTTYKDTESDKLREAIIYAMQTVKPLHYAWTKHDNKTVEDTLATVKAHIAENEKRIRIDENRHHWHRQKAIEDEAKSGGVSGYFIDRITQLESHRKDNT